ncbi:single-stranded DNA-binding protein [Actinomycetes bacterium M1A6_2h]
MARPKIDQMKVAGNLVDDPQRINTAAGQELVVMKIAENNRVFDRQQNQWTDGDPNYYEVAVDAQAKRLGNLAANVESSLHKGDRVSVEGSYAATPYQAKDGSLGVNHRIWADEVAPSLRFASATVERNPAPGASASASAESTAGWDTAAPGSGAPAAQTQQTPPAPPEPPRQESPSMS